MIKIIRKKITKDELKKIAQQGFGEMIKAVIDIKKEILAIGGELHADEETFLLEKGSQQRELWGINIYPAESKDKMIEFSALINIRPSQDNYSMEIKNHKIRKRIKEIINKLVE